MKKVFTFLAIAATLCLVSCKKDNGNKNNQKENNQEQKQEEEQQSGPAITIDGQFDDWSALATVVAKNNDDSPWDAVKEIRVYADPDFVFYYIKYDKEIVKDLLAETEEELPIRLCINTDGEFTSGYEKYFLQSYDFIIEGSLAGEGAFVEYAGTLFQRVDGSWNELLPVTSGIVIGKGAGNEYEIMLARELFNNAVPAGMKMGDVFHTGIRFYYNGGGSWEELSNMPNSSIDDGDGNGWGNLLEVTTTK